MRTRYLWPLTMTNHCSILSFFFKKKKIKQNVGILLNAVPDVKRSNCCGKLPEVSLKNGIIIGIRLGQSSSRKTNRKCPSFTHPCSLRKIIKTVLTKLILYILLLNEKVKLICKMRFTKFAYLWCKSKRHFIVLDNIIQHLLTLKRRIGKCEIWMHL